MNKSIPLIETSRLILRPFALEDIEPSYQMNLDEEVSRYTGDGGVVSMEEMKRRIVDNVFGDYSKHGFGRMAVELKGESKFIGFAGLKYLEDLKEVDIGYRFMKKYWGRGIATEAGKACLELGFEELKLDKIIGLVIPENTASSRVLKKLHFSYLKNILDEGTLVEYYELDKEDWIIFNS